MAEQTEPVQSFVDTSTSVESESALVVGTVKGEMPDNVKEIARQNSEAMKEMVLTKKSPY
jgi:hypothetical protein